MTKFAALWLLIFAGTLTIGITVANLLAKVVVEAFFWMKGL